MKIDTGKFYILTENLAFDYEEEIGPDNVRGHWRLYVRGRPLTELSALLPMHYRQHTLNDLLCKEFVKRLKDSNFYGSHDVRLKSFHVLEKVINVELEISGRDAKNLLAGWMPEAKPSV